MCANKQTLIIIIIDFLFCSIISFSSCSSLLFPICLLNPLENRLRFLFLSLSPFSFYDRSFIDFLIRFSSDAHSLIFLFTRRHRIRSENKNVLLPNDEFSSRLLVQMAFISRFNFIYRFRRTFLGQYASDHRWFVTETFDKTPNKTSNCSF